MNKEGEYKITIIPLARIVSLGNAGVYTSPFSSGDALARLINGDGDFAAVEVANPFPLWPRLDNFQNDDNPSPEFVNTTNPRYIWNKQIALPGETVYFAVGSNFFPLNTSDIAQTIDLNLSLYMTAFADNAFEVEIMRLDLFVGGVNFGSFPLLELPSLKDGPLIQPNPELIPFGWQTVRFYSNSYNFNSINALPDSRIRLIVAFKAVNYPTPTDPVSNPGALAFNIDLYRNVE